MKSLVVVLFCGLSVASTLKGQTSLNGAQWRARPILRNVVLILGEHPNSKRWLPLGTGVLVDFDSSDANVFLVTNRHIYMSRDILKLELRNFYSRDSLLYHNEYLVTIQQNKDVLCPNTPDSDFVAIPMPRVLDSVRLDPFGSSQMISSEDVDYGAEVEFYGYPSYANFRLLGAGLNMPILRRGAVSYFVTRDVFNDTGKILSRGELLIDGISEGGNSGGPVFLRSYSAQKIPNVVLSRRLVGIIRGHFTLRRSISDSLGSADSIKTGPVTSVGVPAVQLNSGLAIVIPIDMVGEYVRRVLQERRTSKGTPLRDH